MKFRFAALAMMIMVVSLGSGCVSTGTYQAKEQESLQLSRSLEESKAALGEISDKNAKLTAETEALNGKLKKLDAEFAGLKDENARLKDDNSKLKDENAKLAEVAKPENLLKTLANLLAALQNENSRLKLSLEDAEKSAKKGSEPLKITPDITRPAPVEEKKAEEKSAPGSKAEAATPEPVAAGQQAPGAAPKPE